MEIYIEKEFLDNFNSDYRHTEIYSLLRKVFIEYGNKKVFINYFTNSPEDLLKQQLENELLGFISKEDAAPTEVENIKEHLFNNSNFEQTLVFMQNKELWFDKAIERGALCFYFDNYEAKIKEILMICASIKIDLSEKFPGWQSFKDLRFIPKNRILLNDKYILTKNAIVRNYIPLVCSILAQNTKAKLEVYTDYLNNHSFDQNAIYSNLCKEFEKTHSLDIEIIHLMQYPFKFHDRILYSNFFIIECPIGFDFKEWEKSNSKLTVETIFDKFNYKRISNHLFHLSEAKKEGRIIK